MKIYLYKQKNKTFLIVVIDCFILFQVRLRHIEVSGSIYNSNVQRLIDGKKRENSQTLAWTMSPSSGHILYFSSAVTEKKLKDLLNQLKWKVEGK